jgi:hypothetical protein
MLRFLSLAFVLALCAGVSPARAEEARPPQMRVLVPAYFYPAGAGLQDWNRMIDTASKVPIVAIANPGSGPGEKADPAYLDVIGRAVKAGVKVIGYVSTSYAKRPRAEVEADVERWLKFYPAVQGFFFDEQTSDAEHAPYYAALAGFAKKQVKDALVVTNPGTTFAKEYLASPGPDVVCIFENREGFDAFKRPEWSANIPAERFAALAYQVGTSRRMAEYVERAARQGMGYFYVTDAMGANPWDRLPAYWQAEVDAVREVNASKKPGPFTYLPETHWAYDALRQFAQRGVFDPPFRSGTGRPAYTRYQCAVYVREILSRLQLLPDSIPVQGGPESADAR